jgi:hypothetical protein
VFALEWRAGRVSRPTLPFAAIVDYCGTDDATLAEMLGLTRRTVQRCRSEGRVISLKKAEDYAHALGVHPTVLWSEYGRLAEADYLGDE